MENEQEEIVTIVGFRKNDPRIMLASHYFNCMFCTEEMAIAYETMVAIGKLGRRWTSLCYDCMLKLRDDQVTEIDAIEDDGTVNPTSLKPSDFADLPSNNKQPTKTSLDDTW